MLTFPFRFCLLQVELVDHLFWWFSSLFLLVKPSIRRWFEIVKMSKKWGGIQSQPQITCTTTGGAPVDMEIHPGMVWFLLETCVICSTVLDMNLGGPQRKICINQVVLWNNHSPKRRCWVDLIFLSGISCANRVKLHRRSVPWWTATHDLGSETIWQPAP